MRLAVLAGYHEHIVIIDFLLAVGEFEKLFIGLVELFGRKFTSEHVQAVFESGASAAGGEHD